MIDIEQLKQQALELKLHGVLAHWGEITDEQYPWRAQLIAWELAERKQRSLERRLSSARLGRFKPMSEFDWQWPSAIDPQAIHALMQLGFMDTASNIILLGQQRRGQIDDRPEPGV